MFTINFFNLYHHICFEKSSKNINYLFSFMVGKEYIK